MRDFGITFSWRSLVVGLLIGDAWPTEDGWSRSVAICVPFARLHFDVEVSGG